MATQSRHIDIKWNPRREDIGRLLPPLIYQLKPQSFEVVQQEDSGIEGLELRVDGKTFAGENRVLRAVGELVRNPEERADELEERVK